ncbi:MAG: hypothetical protein IH945_11480 [Armatimonadetes bacterium]|nr:hypothetical protein [Armatimonadota bacterium]
MFGPWGLVIVCAIIGAWFWDTPGAFGGLAVGFVLAMALGRLIGAVKGGVLPRKEREKMTQLFIQEHTPLINSAFPDEPVESLPKLVSEHIEQILHTAMAGGTPGSIKSMERWNVKGIARQIAEDQPDQAKRNYWTALWEVLEREVYPD